MHKYPPRKDPAHICVPTLNVIKKELKKRFKIAEHSGIGIFKRIPILSSGFYFELKKLN